MVEHQGGLRFDIYERVHLSEGVAGIKELEDVELVPHIQVLPYGDQALLRGNLLLSGTYVDEQDAINRTLEHLIPVEITLPMNRVHRVEDIAVEIENFDVDLLSARSLNITGVLSLNGLEVVPSPQGEGWGETEEEVVFVHQVPRNTEYGDIVNKQEQPQQQWLASEPVHSPENEPVMDENAAYSGQSPRDEQIHSEEHAPSNLKSSGEIEEESVSESLETFQPSNESLALSDEKKELKIAFTGKKAQEEKAYTANGLASLLGSTTGKHDGRAQDKLESGAQAVGSAPGQKLEWKKLLLSTMNEKQEFRRVRLCIVQKEETLETIARRYELNPREIALFNRLGENNLTEGQVVYIPK
ncbi:LysM peptidoglycan-binding domain-containing protein [Paenibacillus radicis (ex Xue et al. 2023)]|uniref:LysM peptidoglycan-binding domain-containing protein n=1 Tax=Paenibacillus radicis (ex Xue et al. 2023) TaxID=2972489 RepID=A0ABT1Y8T2_9BACL|nr:LysM peptidoglycan-binding domain-containing protein [Paenibacillus radicis (ex Xue et al. 2023)]MCR8629605.1 LysM peptidoglycan-binding domain-containing protein [Paenibacillus radicis (ex Xue et al. 2023)]